MKRLEDKSALAEKIEQSLSAIESLETREFEAPAVDGG